MILHVYYNEEEIESRECDKAVKDTSAGKITLYRNGLHLGTYEGIGDFSKYVLTGGNWSDPEPSRTEEQLRADIDYLEMENESLTAEAEQSRADIDYAMMLLGEEVE